MGTTEDLLTSLVDEKNERIEGLEGELREALRRLESDVGWSLPREVEDEYPGLPLPRLEVTITPTTWVDSEIPTWSRRVTEYRLVRRHLLGHVEVTPMGRTVTTGGDDSTPWPFGPMPAGLSERGVDPEQWRIAFALPFRDGAHARHDAAHLGLPLYVQTETGMELLVPNGHQAERGAEHRRCSAAEGAVD